MVSQLAQRLNRSDPDPLVGFSRNRREQRFHRCPVAQLGQRARGGVPHVGGNIAKRVAKRTDRPPIPEASKRMDGGEAYVLARITQAPEQGLDCRWVPQPGQRTYGDGPSAIRPMREAFHEEVTSLPSD